MKMRIWAMALLAAYPLSVTASEVVIDSFHSDGTLSFNEITNVAAYKI